ncbi:MAG TPA: tetratricopeptide repeat protein, partial [Nannocystaceae bacterium]|nr:tetratricopeptide repeat protein [Nannocystaceae bacterium]
LLDLRTRLHDARQRRCLDDTLASLASLVAAATPSDDDDRSPQRLADAITAIEAVPTCEDPALAHWQPSPDPAIRQDLDRAHRLELEGAHAAAEALARRITASPQASPYDRAEALYRLGHVLAAERRQSAAAATLLDAQHLAFATGHDDLYCRAAAHRAKLVSLVALAPDLAQSDLQTAAACVERLGSRSPHLRADLLEARGLLADATGDHTAAIAFHQEALTLRVQHLGEHHLETTKSHQNLANALTERNQGSDRSEAQNHLDTARAHRRALLGPKNPLVADLLVDLGDLLAQQDDDLAARPHFAEALAIYDASAGHHDTSQAKLHTALADLDLRAHDRAAADPAAAERLIAAADHLAKARAHHQRADLPPDHLDRIHRLTTEAQLATRQRDFIAAEAAYAEALALARPPRPHTLETLDLLADWIEPAYAALHRPQLAVAALDAGPALRDRLVTAFPPARRAALAWYTADALVGAGLAQEAAPYFRLALDAYLALPDPPRASIAELRWELARALPPESRAESLDLARAALADFRGLGHRDHITTISRWLREHAASN